MSIIKKPRIVFHQEPTGFNLAVAILGLRDELRNLPVVIEEQLDGYIQEITTGIRVWEDEYKTEWVLYESLEDLLDEEGVETEEELEVDYERVLVIR